MKKLLLKIRYKLIHWLGGYTEQYNVPTERYYIHDEDHRIITVRDNVHFSSDHERDMTDMMEQIAHKIAMHMLDTRMIRFTETKDPFKCQSVLHGAVDVLLPY